MTDNIKAITVSDEQQKQYDEEGYTLFEQILSPEDVAQVKTDIMGVMDAIGLGQSELRQTTEYLKDTGLDHMVNSPNLLNIVNSLLKGESTLYMPFSAVKSAQGGGSFHFHQDNQYTKHDGPSINMWIALVDMTPENGCLYVQPKSHLDGTLERFADGEDGPKEFIQQPEDAIPVYMKAGDCVAFSRLTVHGSGKNSTNDHRVAYALQYHRNDTRAYFDDRWELLTKRPRFQTAAVEAISA